jgi:hypothetical protein
LPGSFRITGDIATGVVLQSSTPFPDWQPEQPEVVHAIVAARQGCFLGENEAELRFF